MNWKSRIRSAFAAAAVLPDDDIIEELAQHAAATYEAARADGEANDAATLRVEQQIALWVRDGKSFTRRPRRPPAVLPPPTETPLETGVLHDLRYAFRLVWRKPGFTSVAVVTMALGIGTTTVLFSLTWGVLMKPLPWPNADRLVIVKETRGGNPPRFNSFSNTAYAAWREKAALVEHLVAWSDRAATVTGLGDPERIRIVTATASLFPALGVKPLAGSFFREEDELSRVAVIAESLWRQRFGSDPDAIGRALRLDGQPFTIVGVMPDAVAYPNPQIRAWVSFRPPVPSGNSLSMFEALALLRPGVSAAQAAAEGTARGAFAADTGLTTTAIFGSTGAIQISAQPLNAALTADVRLPLFVLLAAVALLLASATANVASLQLARATTRRRELAIRAAIGAGAGRLTRQLLVESVLLGLAGGAAGLGLAWLLHGVVPVLLPADFPRLHDVGVSGVVVSFALAVSLLASVGFGILPALGVRRINLVDMLADDGAVAGAAGSGVRTARARSIISGAQVAIACVLLVGASLLGRSFIALLHADRGYDPSNVLTARLSMPDSSYSRERRHVIADQILNRLSSLPGVTDAAFTSELPLSPGGSTAAFTMRSPNAAEGVVSVQASPRIVSPRAFSALRLRVVSGRGFAETDTDTTPPVAVVNRAFSRRYLRDAALGARVPMGAGYGMESTEATIVGIVDDIRHPASAQSAHPEIYYSFRQMTGQLRVPGVTLLLRTSGDPAAAGPALRSAVREADPNLAPDAVVTMSDRVLTTLARPRLYAALVGGFALFAIVIAGVGLFGVLSYTVAQRSRELGVRAALGASPSAIVRLVLAGGLGVTGAGIVVGLGAALAVVRGLGTFLYGVTPYDALTFGVVPVVLGAVAALACFLPARRAARIDPLRVLRGNS